MLKNCRSHVSGSEGEKSNDTPLKGGKECCSKMQTKTTLATLCIRSSLHCKINSHLDRSTTVFYFKP